MVVLRVHRRAASVPVGEPRVSDDTNYAAQNSLLFSRAAIDNTDALSTASKRNDQQFLRDVNSLIGNSANNQPYVKASIKKTHHGHPSAYPLTNRRRSIAVSSVLRPPLPISDDTTDADVDYEVKLLAPITNRLSRYGGRATSVPPQSVTLTSHPLLTKHSVLYRDGLAYDHHARPILVTADDAGYYHQTPSIYELHLQSQQPSVTHHHEHGQKLNPVADLAVRQAHRNLDRIESELKSSGEDVPSPRTLVYRAYRDGPAVLRRSSSYHGPRSSTVRTRSPSPVSVVTPVRRTVHSTYTPGLTDAELYEYLPTSTLKRNIDTSLLIASTELNDPPTHVYRTRTDHLPLSYYSPSYTSYSTLPSSIRRSVDWSSGPVDKLILPNVYHNGPNSYVLPSGVLASSVLKKVSTGTHNPVVIHSVSPDVHALTLHTPTPHSSVYTTPSSVYTTYSHAPQKPPIVPKRAAPLPPAQPTPSGFQNVARPKVSDTRRKVRDVLCKVKGDPHYFDD